MLADTLTGKVMEPASTQEEYCYWYNEDKTFLDPEEVHDEDIHEKRVAKIPLNRGWALGSFCHRDFRVLGAC